jgi:hypothetical protein
VKRLEYMLPRADRVRVPNAYGLAGKEPSHEIGDQAIGRPVAAPDDIAGARCGNGDAVTVGLAEGVHGKVRLSESGANNFGARLRARVGVVAAEGIGLAVRPNPFLVLVTFVRGDGDDGPNAGGASHCVENLGSSNHVCFKGPNRIFVRVAYEGLSRQVEDDFGCKLFDGSVQGRGVPNVAPNVLDDSADPSSGEQARFGGGIERISAHGRAELR